MIFVYFFHKKILLFFNCYVILILNGLKYAILVAVAKYFIFLSNCIFYQVICKRDGYIIMEEDNK